MPLENVEATENGHDGCEKKIGNSESVLACLGGSLIKLYFFKTVCPLSAFVTFVFFVFSSEAFEILGSH